MNPFKKHREALDAQAVEAQYADFEQFDTMSTINSIKNGARVVKLCDVPLGIAFSDKDEKHLLDTIHHFGTDLTTKEAVIKAAAKMAASYHLAANLVEADMIPSNELSIRGEKVLLIDGELYDENGNKISD